MKKIKYLTKIAVILPILGLMFSCNPIENDSTSFSNLILMNLTGVDLENKEAPYLQSDVVFVDEDSGSSTIFADSAVATFLAELQDPASITGPSYLNDIVISRYVVTYMRTDGNNTEGVDVPYSFEGYLHATIEIGKTTDVGFIIVREVAKMEPPLVNLRDSRDLGVIQMHAKIEFFGHDLANRNVKATGYLDIFFANYANGGGGGGSPEGGGSPIGGIR